MPVHFLIESADRPLFFPIEKDAKLNGGPHPSERL